MHLAHAGEYLNLLVGVKLSAKSNWLESGNNMCHIQYGSHFHGKSPGTSTELHK